MQKTVSFPECPCGQMLPIFPENANCSEADRLCSCGRRIELRREGAVWAIAATLTPERSVPISGFSREIRMDPRAERYHFLHFIGGAEIPVHVVYCGSSRTAEIKAAGMKASAFLDVDSPLEARRRWVERFETRRRGAAGLEGLPPRGKRWFSARPL